MFKKILLCLDNSDCANAGVDLSIALAKKSGARLTGCHVYAARLHNNRFQQMESGLPPQYQKEEELQRQREVHDSLITKGLQIISDSYIAVLLAKSSEAGVEAAGVSREGKNYEEVVNEAREGGYDLVVLGAFGLGKTEYSRIGSVTERVVRRLSTDMLVTRTFDAGADKKILVAIDGSPMSFGGLLTAIELAEAYGMRVEAISAFDPEYHYKAFRSIAGILTEEAGKVFKFKEQEKLHEEIIDKGLAKIYQDHLDTAVAIAGKRGVKIGQKLLSGKPYDRIMEYARKTNPFMIVMGKTGVHASSTLDIGSNTENCLRELGCHLYISTRTHEPELGKSGEKALAWNDDAKAILEKVPSFARGIVKSMVEEAAKKEGLAEVTSDFMMKVRKRMGGM